MAGNGGGRKPSEGLGTDRRQAADLSRIKAVPAHMFTRIGTGPLGEQTDFTAQACQLPK
ncbi:hypothetical protein GCM10027456_13360 [Kineosporia babensis]